MTIPEICRRLDAVYSRSGNPVELTREDLTAIVNARRICNAVDDLDQAAEIARVSIHPGAAALARRLEAA